MKQYILALDQGTSSSRAIVFDETGATCAVAQKEFRQIFPRSGWVEHDPHEIWASQASVIAEAIATMDINGLNIAGIGMALLQQHFHIIKLDAASYYMPYVPIAINWWWILLLNVGIIAVSYLTLMIPSMIISSIKPSKTVNFE